MDPPLAVFPIVQHQHLPVEFYFLPKGSSHGIDALGVNVTLGERIQMLVHPGRPRVVNGRKVVDAKPRDRPSQPVQNPASAAAQQRTETDQQSQIQLNGLFLIREARQGGFVLITGVQFIKVAVKPPLMFQILRGSRPRIREKNGKLAETNTHSHGKMG